MKHRLAVCILLAQVSLAAQERTGNFEWAMTPQSRRAVNRGLEWIADRQDTAGFWRQHVGFKLNADYSVTASQAPHVGVSSLALMSFMAGGHLPGRGRFGANLTRGLDYVLSCVSENGFITDSGSRMYSHAFATLFLAEIYGMTRRRDVRQALQKSVNLIVDSQNAEGGWRYRPFARESDMSITVCQVLALRSARNVGIHVPFSTIQAAQGYVSASAVRDGERAFHGHFGGGWINEGGAFRYQLRPQTRATFPLTAAGVTTLYASGIYEGREIRNAIEYLQGQLEMFNEYYQGHYFFYYGHYYAVQAFYITGGAEFRRYFQTMRSLLLANQEKDGSWVCDPGPGDVFGTAVATLILQIPMQYLPIFQR